MLLCSVFKVKKKKRISNLQKCCNSGDTKNAFHLNLLKVVTKRTALLPTNALVRISLHAHNTVTKTEKRTKIKLLSFCRPQRWPASGRSGNAPVQAQWRWRMPLVPLTSGTTLCSTSLYLPSLHLPLLTNCLSAWNTYCNFCFLQWILADTQTLQIKGQRFCCKLWWYACDPTKSRAIQTFPFASVVVIWCVRGGLCSPPLWVH